MWAVHCASSTNVWTRLAPLICLIYTHLYRITIKWTLEHTLDTFYWLWHVSAAFKLSKSEIRIVSPLKTKWIEQVLRTTLVSVIVGNGLLDFRRVNSKWIKILLWNLFCEFANWWKISGLTRFVFKNCWEFQKSSKISKSTNHIEKQCNQPWPTQSRIHTRTPIRSGLNSRNYQLNSSQIAMWVSLSRPVP